MVDSTAVSMVPKTGIGLAPSTVLSTVATTLRKTIMKVKLRNTLIEARRGDIILLEKILYLLPS
jgi:hypothetical protein